MPGGEGCPPRVVRPLALDGIFDAVHQRRECRDGDGIGGYHLRPRAPPFHAAELHAQHGYGGDKLQVAVKRGAEVGYIEIAGLRVSLMRWSRVKANALAAKRGIALFVI